MPKPEDVVITLLIRDSSLWDYAEHEAVTLNMDLSEFVEFCLRRDKLDLDRRMKDKINRRTPKLPPNA